MQLGKVLLIVGLAMAAVGFFLWRMPGLFSWFGKLPGDIHYEKNGMSVHFPVVTMIVLSLILTIILNLCARR